MEKTERAFSVWEIFKPGRRLVLLWNLVLIVGGLVLLAFVLSNGFLPELDLSGALSLLASVSLVSLFLILSIFMVTTVGGWVMCSWFWGANAKLRGQIATLFAMCSASGVYAAITIPGEAPQLIQVVAVNVLIVLVVFCGVFGVSRFRVLRSAWPRQGLGPDLGMATGASFIGVVLTAYNAMLFLQLYKAQPGIDDVAQWTGFGVWLLAQSICMGAVASCNTLAMRLKVSGALGAVGFVVLLILSNNPSFVVDRMAKALGIGALQDISVAVTEEGCQVLSVFSQGFLCVPSIDRSVYVIEPVTLRSRFGKQVLIEYTRPLDDSKEMVFKVVVQATEVLGWQRREVVDKVAVYEALE